jgi:hypothetical protein
MDPKRNPINLMKQKRVQLFIVFSVLFSSCELLEKHPEYEKLTKFTQVESISLEGGETAAEISAFDPKTKKLFVVNAVKSAIDVIDMSDPFDLVYESEISILQYGGGVNSVSVSNGLLAAAVEASTKTDPGKVVVWNTADLTIIAVVPVGALPDMVTFSPNGRYIVSANEGESNEDYSVDPNGSVSIIRVPGFAVSTLEFGALEGQSVLLKANGFRTPGPVGTSFAQDVEPEYAAISEDSRTAWVTLQENNAVAKIDLQTATIERILPLGFLDHSLPGNELEASDKDNNAVSPKNWPLKGMYLPDGIGAFNVRGMSLFITANEGDSRIKPTSDDALPPLEEGDLFNEEARVASIFLDAIRFPDGANLKSNSNIGRIKITNTMGDIDSDGDYDNLYSFGTRSFTIRDGNTGQIVYESGSDLESFVLQNDWSAYDDSRSDDKGVEPENVAIGKVGPRILAFIALERADQLVVVDVTSPSSPVFLQLLHTGDAPEGVLFIPKNESPNGKSIVVTSCEGDGTIQVFQLSGEEAGLL